VIQASELRIGNLVYGVNDRVEIILQISSSQIRTEPPRLPVSGFASPNDINPIPLTEEWLLKMRFIKTDCGFEINTGNIYLSVMVENQSINKPIYIQYKDSIITLCEIRHVHQLQNLCFALTGQELTIQ
jgi:hypothetical protein